LPNYYWGKKYDFIPWFLFHTIDGDIIMGWRQRVISIEWQANYKPFDFDEMFKNEKVTKWNKDGIRGIHACSKDDAFNYLKTVRESVNPGYNNFWFDVHLKKTCPENLILWALFLDKLNINAKKALMIDDNAINLEGAQSIGINGFLFNDFDSFKKHIENV